jgi:hypothetical protein
MRVLVDGAASIFSVFISPLSSMREFHQTEKDLDQIVILAEVRDFL